MAHAINVVENVASTDLGEKRYSVDFKGLFKHLVDVLFADDKVSRSYNVNDLSGHMQRDIGINR
ncbi:hypothetical protein [Vibrio marisflavi]|uniref:Uncharacterized protein n=1 Tax=Vibrio marisflavi CECT 7928 TaxID=634439 RepID=A0ABM9A1G3_9VIBR|nr:hypothetical protein [Vibrio marisflavi]CAH0536875.1 hypothetical protein VMF7928_00766 [Vibrio marisflavi CECT 7928]